MTGYIILSVALGIIYAEFSGYILHIVFHSDKVKYLSESHMRHHIVNYGPKMPQLLDIKKQSTLKRIIDSGIGVEWAGPVIIVVGLVFFLGSLLHIPLVYQLSFVIALVLWVVFLFVYMHDALHVKDHWLEKSPIRKWFFSVRQGHDVHHINLSRSGLLNKNNGICFFFFDKLFGTWEENIRPAEEERLQNMYKRFPKLAAELREKDAQQ